MWDFVPGVCGELKKKVKCSEKADFTAHLEMSAYTVFVHRQRPTTFCTNCGVIYSGKSILKFQQILKLVCMG